MLDTVRLLVSERAHLQQKIERMVGVVIVSSRDEYELFEAGWETRYL